MGAAHSLPCRPSLPHCRLLPSSCVLLSPQSPPVPRLHCCLVRLIAAIARVLCCHWHHHLTRHIAVVAVVLCSLSSSPLSPHASPCRHCRCPVRLIAITSHASSPSPCAPRPHHLTRPIAVALCASSPSPCIPYRLRPVRLPSNTRASALAAESTGYDVGDALSPS